jgi:HEAT repeat protein
MGSIKLSLPVLKGWLKRMEMNTSQPPAPGTDEELVQTPEAEATETMNHKLHVKGLINLLKSDCLDSLWKAAKALGKLGDPESAEPLVAALKDPYVDVQWLAAKSLGMIGDRCAVEPLIAALSSTDKWLHTGAAWGLGKLRDVEPLVQILQKIQNTEFNLLPLWRSV